MANLTVFQRLGQLFNGGNVNSYNIHKNPDDDVIIKTTSKEEYDLATMQARQQHLLAKQWRRAQYDVENRSIAGLNEIKLMYREVDLMDLFPEIGTALDVVTEECTYINDGGSVLNITSGSERIKSILQDLFVNRLSINTMLPMICRGMCKYGNDFLLLNMDAQNGVTGWKELPVYEMERYESGMDNPYITAFNSNEILDPYTKNGTKFVWVGNTEYIPYRDWQIAHFRLLYNSLFLPYGCVVGDTMIETEYGFKEIKDIQIGDKVWTFDEKNGEKELSDVTMSMYKGEKDVFILRTKHNYVEATSDHRFLVYENGDFIYKELKDIQKGDRIVINKNASKRCRDIITIDKSELKPYEYKGTNGTKWWEKDIQVIPDFVDEDFAEFFGFMIGDGWINDKQVCFALGKQDSINYKMMNYIEKISGHHIQFFKQSKKSKSTLPFSTAFIYSKALSIILKRMGFSGNSHTKRLPKWIYEANESIKRAFINGLMLSDGTYKIANDLLCYNIELANEQLVKDIKVLIQSLGNKSGKIGERIRTTKITDSVTHSFYLNFYELPLSVNKCDKFPNDYSDDVIVEKVKDIEYSGKKGTYDITVSKNDNFFANGIVTHNCSFLHKARRHFRLLSMMEDAMLVYRLERAVERRVFKINVGSIDEADVPSYVQNIANEFKRTPIVDPMTGQIDLRKNILPVWKNTPIPLLDGRIITIEDLANEYNDGKTNFVYSIQDNSLQLVPGKVVWCGKNYTADKMVKVTLDDDSYMVMSPEHEILMRDGSKKRADEVTVGESVMPFYKEIDKNAKKRIEKYEKVYNPNSGKYEYTHRLIANEVLKGFEKYNTVHHIDFNKYNNNPNNLLWCDFNEHRSMHVELNKQRESYKAMQPYNHSELHKQHDEIRRQNKIDFWQNGNTAMARRRMTVAFDDYVWDSLRNAILSNTVYNRMTMLNYINTSLISHLLEINTNKRLHNLKSISREVLESRVHEQGFDTITEYINSIKKNHKVKAVDFVDGDDVYCMTVVGLNGEEDRHNFALMTFKGNGEWNGSGCFVKNCNTEDFFIPVRSDSAPNPIETLPAAQNLTAIDDIKFIQNKVFTALRVPKSFLNFEEAQGDGKNLSLLDVRFSKTVNRIQQALLMELNKIAIIHLILLGFTDDLTNFNITMNNPSSQAEMLELENLAKKITTAKDAISDAGNGIPLMSVTRALKTILKWSDKEISDNLEELRLERALTAELERTSQIIKRTGIFDPVDNIYGEPGAEYSEQPMEGEGGDFGGNGGGGAPVGGGAPIGGGGEIDFGDEGDAAEGMGDEANVGEEGEMGIGEVSNEDNATQGENNNLGESYMRKLLNETLQKQKKVSMDLEKRKLHYADLLKKKINEDNEQLKNKSNVEKVPLYNKNFFVNERLDALQKQLENLVENNQDI